jgi:2-oxoisovalerate dehydrogenase E1 component
MPKSKNLSLGVEWQEISATPADWEKVGQKECLKMLSHMHLIRAFEEELLELDREGQVHGPVHVSVGHEGSMVAALSVYGAGDLVNGSHRGHHLFLAKALNYLEAEDYNPLKESFPESVQTLVYRTMAEILGLSPGYCKGRGGSMHLRWDEAGVIGTNAIVGGGVPLANGAAWAQKTAGKNEIVLTAYGDGSCHIGNVLESLNLAALYDLPLCFYIENNQYAVSTSLEEQARETRMSSRGIAFGMPAYRVDGMNPIAVRVAMEKIVKLLREGKGPAMLETMVYRYYHHGGGIAGSAFGYRGKDEEEDVRKRDVIVFMEEEMKKRKWLTAKELEKIKTNAAEVVGAASARITEGEVGSRVIKAELWPDPASCDDGLRGDLSEFDGIEFVEQENSQAEVGDVKFVQTIAKNMVRRFETDDRIFVMGEDVHRLKGGTNGATKGLPERWPDRCVPTPIAEHGFVGLCGGAALAGLKPVVEIMYPDFALVAADQLFNQIAKARHMYGGENNVPLVLRTKIAIGSGYGTQHSMDPAGIFAMWPAWRIVAPSTPYDYVGLMNSALQCQDPVLVIEHVDLYNTKGPGPKDDNLDYFIELGKARVARSGSAITVLSYLTMVHKAVAAADEMGIDAEVIDLRSLDITGLDWDTIEASVKKTGHVVVLEQGSQTNSYGAFLADEVQRRLFDYLDHPVGRIRGGEGSPSVSKVLERAAFVGDEEIRAGFAKMMADKGTPLAAVG